MQSTNFDDKLLQVLTSSGRKIPRIVSQKLTVLEINVILQKLQLFERVLAGEDTESSFHVFACSLAALEHN